MDETPIDTDTVRLYEVRYAVFETMLTTRKVRVLAADTDEARAKAKSLDPDYLSTVKTPRIVR